MKNAYAEIWIRLNVAWAEFLLANFWNLQGFRFLSHAMCMAAQFLVRRACHFFKIRKFETFWEKVCKQP